MAFRIPRGYERNRPDYQELSEGVRPEASAVPMEAWTGLPPVRIDDLHHDPIVLDAGTCVGLATGGSANGKLFPAHGIHGTGQITWQYTSDDSTWGFPTADQTSTAATESDGRVLPLGVVFQPIYSFRLQSEWTNYKRNENVGVVTDYLIQIPAINDYERSIKAGDVVMVNPIGNVGSVGEYGRLGEIGDLNHTLGRYRKWDGTADSLHFVVGRCFRNLTFATGTASTLLSAESSVTLTTDGSAEFKDLDKVQTVPGLGLAGSGTSGVPAWLTGARSDGSGNYHALTILVRL